MGRLNGLIEFLTAEEIELIHNNSIKILSEIGFYIPNELILDLLGKNNCEVDYKSKIVKANPFLIEKALNEIPKEFSSIPYIEENKISFNDGNLKLTMDTTPDIIELTFNKKRRGTLEDTLKGIVLGNYLKNINTVSAYCLPEDVPAKCADVVCYKNLFTYSKKPVATWTYSANSAKYIIEMAKVLAGGEDELKRKKPITYFAESISPLKFSPHTLEIMIEYSKYEQPIFLGPMVTAGGSGPVTLAGTISLQNAEVLMGIVIIYLLNPKQPIAHASVCHILDMKTGICSYGSPEQTLLSAGVTQLARKYGLSCCCNIHISDSNCCDFQRGYEAAVSAAFGIAAGAEMLSIYGYGPVGAVGSGVGLSLEQMLIDDEGLSYLSRIRKGFEVSEDTLAYDVIRKVGVGGNFIQEEHTFKNFKKEQWNWDLFLRQNYNIWQERGSKDILSRAKQKLERILSENFPPEPVIDSSKLKAIKEIGEAAVKNL
ncbi:MAG: trimethylamine methyltransferase family protein [Actinobacteria bacterium]|nr:trimethylamine methyltransferase family protein [Actinomycetota bacterium]